ncbi:mCG147492 [Mus musculus]|nr:mCG147492 [Mus musculus]
MLMSSRSTIHRSGAWVSWSISPAEGSTKSTFFIFHINLQIPLYVVILSGVGLRENTIIFIFISVLFTPLDPSCGVSGPLLQSCSCSKQKLFLLIPGDERWLHSHPPYLQSLKDAPGSAHHLPQSSSSSPSLF